MEQLRSDISTLGISRVLQEDYAAVLERIPAALKAEGFGVLTEIDVRATLHEKLGVDFRRYKILGACNPPAAYRVLSAEPKIGLLLPCNVVVYEVEDGSTCVSAFDPLQVVAGVGFPESLHEVAADIRGRLERAIQAI